MKVHTVTGTASTFAADTCVAPSTYAATSDFTTSIFTAYFPTSFYIATKIYICSIIAIYYYFLFCRTKKGNNTYDIHKVSLLLWEKLEELSKNQYARAKVQYKLW